MITKNKVHNGISYFLKAVIAALIVLSVYRQQYFMVFASTFVLFLSFLPAIFERSFKFHLPSSIDLLFTIILTLHFVLGEYDEFYYRISWWDIFLHSGNSLILGLVGFVFAYSLLTSSRIKAKPFFIALFSLSFTVLIGVIWEIFEFFMDYLFGFNMQKSGLVDTMTDLMADTLGGFVISLIGFFYIKKPWPGIIHSIVTHFSKAKRKAKQRGKRIKKFIEDKIENA